MTKTFVNAIKTGYSDVAVLSWSRFPHSAVSQASAKQFAKRRSKEEQHFTLTVCGATFLCIGTSSHHRVCHIFVYVFVCFVSHFFLIPFGSYYMPCLLNICNWGGSRCLFEMPVERSGPYFR